jgi:hypothetical protein
LVAGGAEQALGCRDARARQERASSRSGNVLNRPSLHNRNRSPESSQSVTLSSSSNVGADGGDDDVGGGMVHRLGGSDRAGIEQLLHQA